MTAAANSFDLGLAQGTALTTGNTASGGTGFNTVSGTVVAETSVVAHGTGAAKLTGGTSTFLSWTSALGTMTATGGRVYLRLSSTASPALLRFVNSGGIAGRIDLTTTGKIAVKDVHGTAVKTGTVTVPTGSYFRLEWSATLSATSGSITAQLFLSPESTSPDDTITGSGMALANSINEFRVGCFTSGITAFVDELSVDTDGSYPGPLTTAYPTSGTAALTLTGTALNDSPYNVAGAGDIELSAQAAAVLTYPTSGTAGISLTAAGVLTAPPRPAVIVEVAFNANPNSTDTPTWTDISNRVLLVDPADRSKRTVELDRFSSGTATMILDNSDGAFSPANTSSPYYPNLLPMRPIRARSVYGAVSYPLWQGFVDKWPQGWVDPAYGQVRLECVDAMAAAAQITMSSVYNNEVLDDGPLLYYPLTDGSGAAQAANQSADNQQNAVVFHNNTAVGSSDAYSFGSTLAVAGADPQQGLSFTTTGTYPALSGYGLRLPAVPVSWAGWTFELWFAVETGKTGVLLWASDYGYITGPTVRATINNTGHLVVQIRTPDGITATGTTSAVFTDGLPHHLVVAWTSPAATVTVDNATVLTLTCTGSRSTITRSNLVQLGSQDTAGSGAPIKSADGSTGTALDGTVGQLAFYNGKLSTARIAAHWQAAQGWPGDSSATRATRLLNYASWPVVAQDVQPGRSTMQAASGIAGRSLLECLQDIADTESGTLSGSNTGALSVYGRQQRMSQSTPVVIFGSNVAAGEIPYLLPTLTIDYDTQVVYNEIQVQRKNGASPTVYDTGSILAYFERGLSRSSYANTDAEALFQAQWLLSRYAQPALRAQAVTVDLAAMGADVVNPWPQLLGLDLHQQVRLIHRPLGAPPITLDGYVDQLTHKYDPAAGTWTVDVVISPQLQPYWLLGVAGRTELDSTTVLSY